MLPPPISFFFFHATPPTEIYTLSLHDALPISDDGGAQRGVAMRCPLALEIRKERHALSTGRDRRCFSNQEIVDRKSTRLNSSHQIISYAVFCLKKKKTNIKLR